MPTPVKLAIAVAALSAAIVPPAAAAPSGSTAPAQVFFPNPVQTLRDETLTDQKDANYAALGAAYRRVTLTDLDGSGTLTGAYAKVRRLPRRQRHVGGHARHVVRRALRGRLGLDLLYVRAVALLAAGRRHLALPRGRRGRGARSAASSTRPQGWGR